MDNIFETKDKQITPFLLTQPNIKFLGTRVVGSIVYFRFVPYNTCSDLINAFITRKASLVQPKELLDAVEAFRDVVFEMKEKEKYGTIRAT